MTSFPSNHQLLLNKRPWANNPNAIWLASSLSLNRNLQKFNFPNKLPEDKRKQVLDLIWSELSKSEQLKNPQLFLAHEVPPIEKEFLVEHFLSNQGFHQASRGEAFVLDETGQFLSIINLRDHLILQAIDIQGELEKTWEKLIQIESGVQNIHFAFHPKFGFLTADPMLCGTGLTVFVFLHLPSLIHTDSLIEAVGKHKEDSIELTGLQGDPEELIGDIVVLRNIYTLGVTEENILTSIRTTALKLILEEKTLRHQFLEGKSPHLNEMKDRVSRAFGILLHSYQIETPETLLSLSLLKLGLDLKWIEGITHQALNELLFSSRRAHLLCQDSQGKILQEELLHKRAEYIHNALKGTTLLI